MNERPVTAFVVGATGFTGREVVAVLAEQNHRVIAHVRADSSRLSEWKQRFEALGAIVDSTQWDREAMTATLGQVGATHVFSLLGTTRKRAAGEGMAAKEAYERVDYGLTSLMIGAAADVGSIRRFIYLSSVGVKPGVTGAYLAARAKAEAELRQSGLEYVIARPSFITGGGRDDNRPMERIGAAVGDSLLAAASALGAKRLRAKFRSTDPRTLAIGLVYAGVEATNRNCVLEGGDLRLVSPVPRSKSSI